MRPWPKPSADKKKCAASSTNLNQFNFFETNDASKPPPAASKHSYPDAAFAYFGNPELFDPAAVGTSNDLQTRAKSGLPIAPQTQARSRHSSGLQTQAGLGLSNSIRMRR